MNEPTPHNRPGPHQRDQAADVTTSSTLSIQTAQQQVDQWIQEIGVRYFSELSNLAQLVEEVGELSRIINRTYGEQSFKQGEQPSDLSDELADVLFVLICLANQTGVDLATALENNLAKKTDRDRDRHQQNPKLTK
jgi:NTP pyrophosphatase (non-canonical NTP hydrolase)